MVGFEGSGTLASLVVSLIASPLDLMLMTARVITTGPEDRGSSLWLLVSESGRKQFNHKQFILQDNTYKLNMTSITKKNLPGGDPDPLEQLEFPNELNPEDEAGGLLEAVVVVVEDLTLLDEPLMFLTPSALPLVLGPDTVNDVLKWCLLPDLTGNRNRK